MGALSSSLPASAARALFLSLAMAAAASAFFSAAGAVPSLPHHPPKQLDAGPNSISAAPSFLPAVPRFSTFPPASAPDAMPVLPTPRGAGKAAPAGSLPVIPSNPSPPNPDQFGPTSALVPVGSSAAVAAPSAAVSLRNWPARVAAEAVGGALLLLLLWF